MARNLDTDLAAALSNKLISPVLMAALTLTSGVAYIWSGVGNLVYQGNTYIGVGSMGKISPITEGSGVMADGMSITLSGIGASPFPPSDVPPGVSNPVSVPMGQYVAWAQPQSVSIFDTNETSETIITANPANSATNTSASAFMQKPESASTNWSYTVGAAWSDFQIPSLPAGAMIQSIYPVVVASSQNANAFVGLYYGADSYIDAIGEVPDGSHPLLATGVGFSTSFNTTQFTDTTYTEKFTNATSALSSMVVCADISNSQNVDWALNTLQVDFVGFAIYYTAPSNTPNLINQAIADIAIGAPAQVYFGLYGNGQLIGNPYRIFAGQVDQPDIKISPTTASITIALENKLSNLLRPTARRYTAADQHLMYPDDIGLNWVEILNDIALRWGS
ncbi:MAG TPA: hypothetical protein VGF96_05895 [Terracidiphilus sp.]|jgi:hypothetical protein